MSVLAVNKRANFDYDISEKFEAGIVLFGHEVKSIKTGHASMKGSFVTTRGREGRRSPDVFLTNVYISPYKHAGTIKDYDAERPRKLLLKKKEVEYLLGKRKEQGLTLVPIKIYTKRSLIKLEFGIGRGRKKYDKREVIKKREAERQIRTLTKRNKL